MRSKKDLDPWDFPFLCVTDDLCSEYPARAREMKPTQEQQLGRPLGWTVDFGAITRAVNHQRRCKVEEWSVR